MSRSADVDLLFESPIDRAKVLRAMQAAGVDFCREGFVNYLLDEFDDFDWVKREGGHLDEVIMELVSDRWARATVGITGYFPDSEHGGDFMFNSDRLVVSFLVTANRREVPGSVFSDMGWYLQRLIPIFEPLGATGIELTDVS